MKPFFPARMAGPLCLVLFTFSAGAAEPEGKRAVSFHAGLTLTDGNSEALQAHAGLLAEGERRGLGSYQAGLEAGFAESRVGDRTETTRETARLFGNAKRTLTPRTYANLDAFVMTDRVAEVDYRAAVSPGFGVFLVRMDRFSLSADAGPAYLWERVDGERADYLAARLSERAELSLGTGAKIWQSAEYLPKADRVSDYLLNAELGAESQMNARVSLRLVFQARYDSEPGADLEKLDLTLIAGLGVKL